MSTPTGAGRYAPSPSGELHLGNLRTAMLAWLFARSSGRSFLIRIEDLDRERDRGAADLQLAALQAIGLDWDAPPLLQTTRESSYVSALAALTRADLVYECTCSRREIAEAPSAPHAAPGAYPGTCRERDAGERAAERAAIFPRLPALRLRVPAELRQTQFTDLLLGSVQGSVDDFVLQRGDGAIAYNFAVVVDDAFSGIDQVVRGDDLAASTPRQIVLQQLLQLPTPEYAHVPLVLGSTGARLAKRDGAVTLIQMQRAGLSADRVRSLLAKSLGLCESEELVSMEQLVQRFNPAVLPRTPWTWPGLRPAD